MNLRQKREAAVSLFDYAVAAVEGQVKVAERGRGGTQINAIAGQIYRRHGDASAGFRWQGQRMQHAEAILHAVKDVGTQCRAGVSGWCPYPTDCAGRTGSARPTGTARAAGGRGGPVHQHSHHQLLIYPGAHAAPATQGADEAFVTAAGSKQIDLLRGAGQARGESDETRAAGARRTARAGCRKTLSRTPGATPGVGGSSSATDAGPLATDAAGTSERAGTTRARSSYRTGTAHRTTGPGRTTGPRCASHGARGRGSTAADVRDGHVDVLEIVGASSRWAADSDSDRDRLLKRGRTGIGIRPGPTADSRGQRQDGYPDQDRDPFSRPYAAN